MDTRKDSVTERNQRKVKRMDVMNFPQTVDEFMEQYKIVDREEVYTNGAELIPIFRMRQWFEHEALNKAPTFDWLMQKADEWGMAYGKQFLIEVQRAWKDGKDIDVPTKEAIPYQWIVDYLAWLKDIGGYGLSDARAVQSMLIKWKMEHTDGCGPDYCDINFGGGTKA